MFPLSFDLCLNSRRNQGQYFRMSPILNSPNIASCSRLTRRDFLKRGGAAMVLGAVLPAGAADQLLPPIGKGKPVKIGIIADLHHGLQPDATQRLETFLSKAE